MDTEHRFDPYGSQAPAEKRERSWLSTCLIGCLVMTVVAVVLLGVAAYWISQNWRGWVSDLSTLGINELIENSQLPPEEKQEIKAEVNRLIDSFRAGRLSAERLGMMAEQLAESPLLTMIIVSTVDRQYFDKSGLSEEEQTAGKKTLQRFLRGAIDGTIDRDAIDAAMAHVADRQPDRSWRLRRQVTDEQLRAFLAAAKAEADAAAIPDDHKPFDPSDEIKRIVDEALAEPAAQAEPAEPAEQAEPAEAPLPE